MAKKTINGVDYDLQGTDWQGEINKAKASGDYKLAAQFEQARNEKINSGEYKANGGKQTTTSNYAGWLDGTDYASVGMDQIKSGASAEDVLKTYNNRINKASSTTGMEQYINDDYSQAMLEYIAKNSKTPEITEYESSRSPQIDAMLDSILNREPFSYDYSTDPVYQAYAQQYKMLGDKARENTLGDIAALNGGYASSWAASAASQAQNDYNSQLSGKIPELEAAAYNRYLTEDSLMRDDLNLLLGIDQTEYGRYRDTVADSQWQQQFDTSNEQWKQTFDWNKTVDQWNMDNTEKTQKFEQLMSKWQMTGVADAEVAAALGVPVGATTESYYFNSAQLALSKAKMAQGDRETAKAEKEKSVIINNIAGQVKNASETGADSYYSGTSLLLELIGQYNNEFGAGLGINDYYTIGAQAGIPSYILDDAFSDMANDLAGEVEPVEKNYLYYASLMGEQDDPVAWLEANKWYIPADILKALRENFIDY